MTQEIKTGKDPQVKSFAEVSMRASMTARCGRGKRSHVHCVPSTRFFLALAVSCAHAQSNLGVEAEGGKRCTPPEWNGLRTATTAYVTNDALTPKPNTTWTFTMVTYSALLQKAWTYEYNLGSMNTGIIETVYDYPGKTMYTVTQDTGKWGCKKTPLTTSFPTQCWPGNASMIQSNASFGVEDNTVQVAELAWVMGPANYHVTIESQSNLPVFLELWYISEGVAVYETIAYNNFTVPVGRIPDSAFTPPDICDHVVNTTAISQTFEDGRLSPLLLYP